MLFLSGRLTAPHRAKLARPVGFEPPTTLEEHQWQKHRPTWALSANPLCAAGACTEVEELAGVPGARVLSNLLSPLECDDLIELSERLGYLEPSEPSAAGRSNACCVVIAPVALAAELACRLAPSLRAEVGGRSVRVNRRLRFYRYAPPEAEAAAAARGRGRRQAFPPHVDGAQSRCVINAAGALIEAVPRLRSSFSLLLYLNGGFAGGETRFLAGEPAAPAPRGPPGAALPPDDDGGGARGGGGGGGGGAGDGARGWLQAAGAPPRAPPSDLAPSSSSAPSDLAPSSRAGARSFTPRRGAGLVFWHGAPRVREGLARFAAHAVCRRYAAGTCGNAYSAAYTRITHCAQCSLHSSALRVLSVAWSPCGLGPCPCPCPCPVPIVCT